MQVLLEPPLNKVFMKKENPRDIHGHIGPRIKTCLLIIWGHLMYLTWLMIVTGIHPICQAISLLLTIIAIYLQIVILQDYFYLKTHSNNKDFRKDVRIFEPLIPERFKKK